MRVSEEQSVRDKRNGVRSGLQLGSLSVSGRSGFCGKKLNFFFITSYSQCVRFVFIFLFF